jgi:hypothetical protein
LLVVGVTANRGASVIANTAIPQPDTIAIQFNRALDQWTVNNSTVQLLAKNGSTYTPVAAAVTYSPATNAVYLTPEAVLSPGTVYVVSVNGAVSDDQKFPSPAVSLGQTFTTTFTVGNAAVGAGHGPLTVTATSPANGTPFSSPLGYVTATFSEALSSNLSQSLLSRFSAMLVPHTGGVTTGSSGYADVPMNAQVAFNPNTNQLIIVPTGVLGNNVYLLTLQNIKAANGDTLAPSPFYATFQLTGSVATPHSVVRASAAAADVAVPAGGAATAAIAAPAVATTTTITTTAPVVVPQRRVRPLQADAAHDHALGSTTIHVRSLLAGRRKAVASGLQHASERHHGSNA